MTLQASAVTKDVIGGQAAGNYSVFGRDQAAIDEVPFIVNGSEHGVLYRIVLKYRSDILTKFETEKKRVQIVGPGRTYNLLEIEDPEQRNIELVLHCAPA